MEGYTLFLILTAENVVAILVSLRKLYFFLIIKNGIYYYFSPFPDLTCMSYWHLSNKR